MPNFDKTLLIMIFEGPFKKHIKKHIQIDLFKSHFVVGSNIYFRGYNVFELLLYCSKQLCIK
jgi:hypothetical protein